MSKQSEYFRGRNDGLALARKIVVEGGIDELDRKIQFTNSSGIELGVTQAELDKASAGMRERSTMTVIAISMHVLIDKFAFSNFQLKQFQTDFTKEIDRCIAEPERLAELLTECEMHGIIVRRVK